MYLVVRWGAHNVYSIACNVVYIVCRTTHNQKHIESTVYSIVVVCVFIAEDTRKIAAVCVSMRVSELEKQIRTVLLVVCMDVCASDSVLKGKQCIQRCLQCCVYRLSHNAQLDAHRAIHTTNSTVMVYAFVDEDKQSVAACMCDCACQYYMRRTPILRCLSYGCICIWLSVEGLAMHAALYTVFAPHRTAKCPHWLPQN